ncbi:hypothetical protein TNCT_670981 [Trichonephila clavata]|uniref:Uncharacterized protein n=1 Tax=Trichonephila clavata TaxID=2740835 RepID=A0A8X6HFM1_TRICU|nr:hypothetical protein TNCT_670981 [Trichonephila clavata]
MARGETFRGTLQRHEIRCTAVEIKLFQIFPIARHAEPYCANYLKIHRKSKQKQATTFVIRLPTDVTLTQTVTILSQWTERKQDLFNLENA